MANRNHFDTVHWTTYVLNAYKIKETVQIVKTIGLRSETVVQSWSKLLMKYIGIAVERLMFKT